MSRLTMLHINIIGGVLALIFGVALYFTIITGATDDQQMADVAYKATKTQADTLPKATKDLEKAKKDNSSPKPHMLSTKSSICRSLDILPIG